MAAKKKTPAKNSPKAKPAKKAAAAVKATDKPAAAAAFPVRTHLTNRYARFKHEIGDEATRTTNKRHVIEAAYPMTVGVLVQTYGRAGLRNAARHAFNGNVTIAGLNLTTTRDDAINADRIAKLPANTAVKLVAGRVLRKSATA